MGIQIIFLLAITTLFINGISRISESRSATFTVHNNCPYTIWPALLTSSGPAASTTGFELPSQATSTINAPAPWSGRIWARFQCSNNNRFNCQSGDCGSNQIPCNGRGGAPPATLIEFTLAGGGNLDFYDVSIVDGFNLPVMVTPRDGCPSTSCPVDINTACPDELAVYDNKGGKIGCKSACLRFGTSEYCCSGDHGTPKTCPPSNYSKYFKSKCPQAYSYAYDDKSSTFTCPNGGDYSITFCPISPPRKSSTFPTHYSDSSRVLIRIEDS
ncbi:thaumatin-like protein 1b [Impatiens glandulifera]|uniref:thaumatin-like protein 1b n=1 Tax=Impatiens glandulifera TaxID=253017 RepID=UPI001FB14589|nr:thaumatin-like protein 1b [Impatiens glandulifera]